MSNADRNRLAHSYLQRLVQAEIKKLKTSARSAHDDLPPFEYEADERAPAPETRPVAEDQVRLAADRVAVAVLVARAIGSERGLARKLDRDAPIVVLATLETALVAKVKAVVEKCVFRPGFKIWDLTPSRSEVLKKGDVGLVARDGLGRDDKPEHGNDAVARALHAHVPIFGIAPDPKRSLPQDLVRAAEYRLSLPALDQDALDLVIEAVTGERPTLQVDAELLDSLEVSDLPLALRKVRSANEGIASVSKVLREKAVHLRVGPALEELDGYGAAKRWGLQLASDLQLYRTGRLSWDEVDGRGLLLSGPPGVGKTVFARALARSARVPLLATSVATWNANEHLGHALRAMRDVFARAAARAPCILFIDELDGISNRARIGGEYSTYWTQIVNLLLELLAGVEERPGVVVIAATNFSDRIDTAVKRSGRLDREIAIEKPDTATLCKIFRYHLGSDTLPDESLMPLALAARGATGADVESWVRRARGEARRAARNLVLDDLLTEIREGRRPMTADERRRTAVHEAGHVVVCRALSLGTIVDLSLHDGGGELSLEHGISGCSTLSHLEAVIAGILAGRVAEQIELKEVAIGGGFGPNSDLARATAIACDIETRFGLGLLGPVHIDSERTTDVLLVGGLLTAVSKRLQGAEERARTILCERRHEMQAVAEALEGAGYLSGTEIEELLDASTLATP